MVEQPQRDYQVIIAGSGISGITTAIALRKAGIDDFLILESAEKPGGVWRDNIYPGVACDIPTVIYQHKDAKKPDWTKFYAEGHEIIVYLQDLQKRFRLQQQTRYETRVARAEYDEKMAEWSVETENGERLRCRYFVKATGAFNSPKMPNLPGLKDFRGHLIHTARWPEDLDLHGKRVAVIGTGASAIQLIPIVAEQAAQLTVYQRTPIWLLPKLEFNISKSARWILKHVPGAHAAYHKFWYRNITYYLDVLLARSGRHPRMHRRLEAAGRWNIRRQLKDPELIAKFTPTYNLGCKRPSFSNNFYAAFNKPTVSLVTEGIETLTEDGILTKGEDAANAFDVIILATGFNILGEESDSLPAFPIKGRKGLDLREYWHHLEGFKAHRGAGVPGFPNLFLNLGIPFASGTSWYETADIISAHIVKCIQVAEQRNAQEIEVKREAVDAYFEHIEGLQEESVFHTGTCAGSNSYYFDKNGKTPLYTAELPDESWSGAINSVENCYEFNTVDRKVSERKSRHDVNASEETHA